MTTFHTSRFIPASPAQVFAAIANPERLARWWGPAGFTNTVTQCDFKPQGQWHLVMHGPDGKQYPNALVFEDIVPQQRVLVRHVNAPHFQLTIALVAVDGGTQVAWAQAFEHAEVAAQLAPVVIPANEQNLDRLSAEVLCPPTAPDTPDTP